ncbi:DUF2786 domain-containing protein [Streptomyces sp. UNOC14_S4]|uniref:DUF2786 domain-containing protein n=1 Tax=Streptomyces sp. UNOC14_S4 TaxID=2872340 RepID=UPI001E479F56|nr:DUF2786 domain-containing protein [Streptomyces sp. UNOC14_S4]MCC3767283.1 DUF2786 domain-containing protein [Streptomyces sp. UNOC14_S4]
MSTTQANAKLSTIRALLAKAEDPAAPEAEADLCRKRAFEMMAKYGVEQAMLNDGKADAGTPTDRVITVDAPWAMERVQLMNDIAKALGCHLLYLGKEGQAAKHSVHLFGYASDLERLELLYTSLLLQMHGELERQQVPAGVRSARAWRRSWLLGFIVRVGRRLQEAERMAQAEAHGETSGSGRSAELVLADRKTAVQRSYRAMYPVGSTSESRSTMTGTGWGHGWKAGGTADIGQGRVGRPAAGAIGS